METNWSGLEVVTQERERGALGLAARALRLLRTIVLLSVTLVVTTALAFSVGYAIFAMSLAREEPHLATQAEGIVALTGGSDRVFNAAELLSRGQARRMLITGVNRATRSSVLAKILPVSRDVFDCCVDLGYQAMDTAGNAAETRDWAHAHNITRSIIVVTSNYHMPRALAEISAALPGVTLVPYPVVSEHVDVGEWARDARVAELIGSEYLKYLGVILRVQLQPERDVEPAETPELRRSAATASE